MKYTDKLEMHPELYDKISIPVLKDGEGKFVITAGFHIIHHVAGQFHPLCKYALCK